VQIAFALELHLILFIMKGNLLINLGSPEELSLQGIKGFLKEFLSDDLVIDAPKLVQKTLVSGFIVPLRSNKTLGAYKRIWTPEGSPLIKNTLNLGLGIEEKTGIPTRVGMRYLQPSIQGAITDLIESGCNEIRVLPLYPQYTGSSTVTSINKVQSVVEEISQNLDIKVRYIKSFYDNPSYIDLLSELISSHLPNDLDHLLFSYHGIPNRQDKRTDPTYSSQCIETSRLCAEKLNLRSSQWSVSFQSRIGPGWLKPFTDKALTKLPKAGKKRLAIISPSFFVDNLETLEEISIEGRATFMEAGGKEFTYIPCLNGTTAGIKVASSLLDSI